MCVATWAWSESERWYLRKNLKWIWSLKWVWTMASSVNSIIQNESGVNLLWIWHRVILIDWALVMGLIGLALVPSLQVSRLKRKANWVEQIWSNDIKVEIHMITFKAASTGPIQTWPVITRQISYLLTNKNKHDQETNHISQSQNTSRKSKSALELQHTSIFSPASNGSCVASQNDSAKNQRISSNHIIQCNLLSVK